MQIPRNSIFEFIDAINIIFFSLYILFLTGKLKQILAQTFLFYSQSGRKLNFGHFQVLFGIKTNLSLEERNISNSTKSWYFIITLFIIITQNSNSFISLLLPEYISHLFIHFSFFNGIFQEKAVQLIFFCISWRYYLVIFPVWS